MKEFKPNFFFSFSFYCTKVSLLIFILTLQSFSLFIFIQVNKMSSSRLSYDSFSNEWTSSSSDEEMLFNEMDKEVLCFSNVFSMFSSPKTF